MGATGRVAVPLRAFAVLLLTVVAVALGDDARTTALVVAALAAVATLAGLVERLPAWEVATAEAAALGIVVPLVAAGPGLPALHVAAAYAVVPVVLAALGARLTGLASAAGAALVVGAVGWLAAGPGGGAVLAVAGSWWLAAVVLGLLTAVLGPARRLGGSGTWAAAWGAPAGETDDASYRDAIALIRQLDAISGQLSGGLDPVTLAEEMMAEAEVALRVRQSGVFTRSPEGEITPLRFSTFTAPGSFGGLGDFLEATWRSDRPVQRATTAALPLRAGAGADATTVAVLVLDLDHAVDQRGLARLQQALAGTALRLQAALLFDHVRAHATSEERNRLAREVHDGVAQDVASLGYMVDGLAGGATDPQQREHLVALRTEVTRVVAELRASVYDLRNEMRAGQGLGQGVSAFARQIGSRSDLTVHVRLDEGATRLRPDIESELLRIAQEAMNNARKHSGGENLWVSCTVRPPYAEIEVTDDGAGLGRARHDSHGLRIMRERAEGIGARLDVESLAGERSGTRLRVRLGDDAVAAVVPATRPA